MMKGELKFILYHLQMKGTIDKVVLVNALPYFIHFHLLP